MSDDISWTGLQSSTTVETEAFARPRHRPSGSVSRDESYQGFAQSMRNTITEPNSKRERYKSKGLRGTKSKQSEETGPQRGHMSPKARRKFGKDPNDTAASGDTAGSGRDHQATLVEGGDPYQGKQYTSTWERGDDIEARWGSDLPQ